MDVNKEIKHIIDSLQSKRKFKEIDGHKLVSLFSHTELDFDITQIKDSDVDRSAIERAAASGPSILEIMKRLRWIAVPAFAVLILAYFFFLKESSLLPLDKAQVYFVKGRVELLRGSKRVKLNTGDEVLRVIKLSAGKIPSLILVLIIRLNSGFLRTAKYLFR